MINIWQFLTRPDYQIEDRGLRQRAALFSAFVLIWLFVYPVAIVMWIASNGWTMAIALSAVGIFAVLSASYGLSRTRHYLIAARLYVVASLVLTFAMYLLIDINHPHQILYYMASSILIAGLVLPLHELVMTIILAETLILLSPVLYRDEDFPLYSAPLFIGVMGLLTMMFVLVNAYYRRAVDESETRFRAIFNQSFHYISVLSRDGRIQDMNEPSYRFFGFEPQAAVGQYLWETDGWGHNAEARAVIQQAIQQAADGKPLRRDITVKNAAGKSVPFDFSIKPVRDEVGTVTMLVAESRDMSAYYQSERKRYEYERRYQSLFENTADAVLIVDMDGTIRNVNRAAQIMFDVTDDDIIGQPARAFVVPDEQEAMATNLKTLQSGQSLAPIIERQMVRSDGHVFAAEITSVVVKDHDGNPQYIHSMIRDLAPRRNLERQRFEIELERERTRLLQRFIEQASHHFRTPITNIKTSTYLLPRLEKHPEKRTQHIQIMNDELKRLDNLLADLLMVLRLQKDDTEFHIMPILIRSLLDEIRTVQIGRECYGDYEWVWDIDRANVTVIGDRERLARAVLNIVDNAVMYTPEGGTINISVEQHTGWLALYVRDTGIGIEADDMPRIFDDFFRSNTAMTQDSTSSGLGLPITKLIIERHQGAISVDSTPNQGTTFLILLPVETDWKAATQPLPDDLVIKLRDSHVLTTSPRA